MNTLLMRGSGSGQSASMPGPRRGKSELTSWEDLSASLEEQWADAQEQFTDHSGPGTVPAPAADETTETLHAAGDWVRAYIEQDAKALKNGIPFRELAFLPTMLPSAYANDYTPEFLERFAGEVGAAEDVLTAYPSDKKLNSTAQELAAHALINESRVLIASYQAQGWTGDGEISMLEDPEATMQQLDQLYSEAFEDHDVLLLFDPELDGLAEGVLGNQVGELMGMVNLGVGEWFKTFK